MIFPRFFREMMNEKSFDILFFINFHEKFLKIF